MSLLSYSAHTNEGISKDAVINQFLDKIAHIESSNSFDVKHKVLLTGPHINDSAIGKWGLMPNTARELLNYKRNYKTNQEISKLLMTNRDLQYKIAKKLAIILYDKHQGNELLMAYAWLHGHNLSAESIVKRNYLQTTYVKKYIALD